MQLQRGFIQILVLIFILVGVVALGGGAYYVTQQKSPTDKDSESPPSTDVSTEVAPNANVSAPTVENTANNTETRKSATVNPTSGYSPSLGNLYITPNKTPTVKVPANWKPHIIYDELLKAGDRMEYWTFVAFSDESKSRAITYQLLTTGGKPIDMATAVGIAEDVLGFDEKSTPISQTGINLYGLSISQILYKNPSVKITKTAEGVRLKVDAITYGISGEAEIVARVFYIPGYIVVVTAASTKESAQETLNGWYESLFASVMLPSAFNDSPNGISVTNYLQYKSKFEDVADNIAKMRATPQGMESDFYLSACYPITVNLSLGDIDRNTSGQVSYLQKMLFEKYKTPGNITGRFDDLTLLSVIRFQREMGLDGSGGIGSKTLSALSRCKTTTSGSAAIDVSSLVTSSRNPVLSGTASGITGVYVSLADRGEVFWHTNNPVPVTNGKWSITVSIPNYTIPPGSYTVLVAGPNNPNNLLAPLTQGALTISN